ncbi:hypothetical protein QTP86_015609 [Hemibagrus guttatus]|nr:hypothetical protein QTP86_015609 [Hemibagrus guttatus]
MVFWLLRDGLPIDRLKMSSSFSANQYDNAFKSNKLQNWTVPKHYKNEPSSVEGHTVFIATDRGHLLPGVKRGSPWTSFQGTWDLPRHIPPVHLNPTARSREGQQRLRARGQVQSPVPSLTGKLNVTSENSRTPQCQETSGEYQHEDISESIPAPDRPELERPIQAQSRPATQQSQVQSRPATQQSNTASRPASTQSQAKSRPLTQASQDQDL